MSLRCTRSRVSGKVASDLYYKVLGYLIPSGTGTSWGCTWSGVSRKSSQRPLLQGHWLPNSFGVRHDPPPPTRAYRRRAQRGVPGESDPAVARSVVPPRSVRGAGVGNLFDTLFGPG